MANKNVTEARVKNVMKHIPRSAMKDPGKMRRTMKATFKGMKTLVEQLSHCRKDYHVIYEKKRKQKTVNKILWTLIFFVSGLFLIILFLIFRFK
jgi:predicted patatin/cPLA2 family phospholipase